MDDDILESYGLVDVYIFLFHIHSTTPYRIVLCLQEYKRIFSLSFLGHLLPVKCYFRKMCKLQFIGKGVGIMREVVALLDIAM